jgi:uncharacterized membrane protein
VTGYVLVLLIGVVAGLRTMIAPAAVSWAIHFGWLDATGTWAALLGAGALPYVLSALAVMELVTDQLPSTPSRTVPMQFAARVISGGLCGLVIGTVIGSPVLSLLLGGAGAVLGTLGGHELRTRLARVNGGRDRPIAFAEDAVALALAVASVNAVS